MINGSQAPDCSFELQSAITTDTKGLSRWPQRRLSDEKFGQCPQLSPTLDYVILSLLKIKEVVKEITCEIVVFNVEEPLLSFQACMLVIQEQISYIKLSQIFKQNFSLLPSKGFNIRFSF